MADPEIIEYISQNMGKHGLPAVKEQLIRDGVPPAEVEAAIEQMTASKKKRKRLSLFVIMLGMGFLVAALYLGGQKSEAPKKEESAAAGEDDAGADGVVRGQYGYILKLPPGYRSYSEFPDAQHTREIVYIFPEGTNHIHFIHEGLYGDMGILRLEVSLRRVPQGFIGIDTLRTWVTQKLDHEKAQYDIRSLMVHGMPAFIVKEDKPFRSVRAHIIGQEVRYLLVGGEENDIFNVVLSSLVEVAPEDRPSRTGRI